MEYTFELSLPPSENQRLIKTRGGWFALSSKAKLWLEEATWVVFSFMHERRLTAVDKQFYLDLYFWLARKNQDSHNTKKLLFDALEKGGLVTNDKLILDRTQSVEYDTKNPRVILKFNH